MSMVNHPNIVSMYDTHEQAGMGWAQQEAWVMHDLEQHYCGATGANIHVFAATEVCSISAAMRMHSSAAAKYQ